MGKGDGQGEGSGAGKGGEITVVVSKKPDPVIITNTNLSSKVCTPFGSNVVLLPNKPKKKKWVVEFKPMRELMQRYRPTTALERYICSVMMFIGLMMIVIGVLLMMHNYGLLPFTSPPTLVFSKKTHQVPTLPRVKPETWEAKTLAPTEKVKLGPTLVSPCKCVHRRMATAPIEGMSSKREAQEIIHDTKARWSALVDKRQKRCLLFNPMTSDVATCPMRYPWIMDRHIGALPCTWGPKIVPGGVLHYTSRVIRLVLNSPMTELEVNKSGSAIVQTCAGFDSYRVIAVYNSYYSQLKRTRRVAPGKLTELLMGKVDDAFDEVEKGLASIDVDELSKLSQEAATALENYGKDAERFLFGDNPQSLAAMSDVLVETVSMAMNTVGVDLKDMDKVIIQK